MINMIIGVDFDGTLCHGNWTDIGESLHKAIEWCKEFNLVFDAIYEL